METKIQEIVDAAEELIEALHTSGQSREATLTPVDMAMLRLQHAADALKKEQ